MGGSRRKLKRGKSKVRVGVVKRKKNSKVQVPLELLEQRADVQDKLGTSLQWTEQQTLTQNYEANKFVSDPNEGFGRNAKQQPLKSKEQREQEEEVTFSDDDELRAASNKERKSGKAPPRRLSSHQRQIVETLVQQHGDDVQAMSMDRKLNPMQHSIGRLREFLLSYQYWQATSRHDFRAPHKPPPKCLLRGVRIG